MLICVEIDLVPENVEAMVRFQALFETARFHRLATPGVEPHTSSDVKALQRVMSVIVGACRRAGMDPPTPTPISALTEAQEQVAEALEHWMAESAGSNVQTVIDRVIDILTEGHQNEQQQPGDEWRGDGGPIAASV